MPTLKEISSFKANLTNSRLASSPLWDMQVDKIIPAQLYAFRAKLKLEGYKGSESLFVKILASIEIAKLSGELAGLPIVKYKEPSVHILTTKQLREGFEKMIRPFPAAILFGLETGLTCDQVIELTWDKARDMALSGGLKTYARLIIDRQPKHLFCDYVFWTQSSKKKPEPLHCLELEVFDTYEMIWTDLQKAYRGMIFIEGL